MVRSPFSRPKQAANRVHATATTPILRSSVAIYPKRSNTGSACSTIGTGRPWGSITRIWGSMPRA